MKLIQAVIARYSEPHNPKKALRRLELVLVTLAAIFTTWGLFGSLGNVLGTGPAALMPSDDSLVVEALALEDPLSPKASEAMLARPLFWDGRRPLDDRPLELIIPKSEPTKPKKLEGVTLHGVFGVGNSLGAIATVNGKTIRVTSNQPIKGWRLESYQNGVAVFSNGSSRQSIPLELVTPNVSLSRQEELTGVSDEPAPQKTPEQLMAEAEQARQEELRRDREDAERAQRAREQGFSFGGEARKTKSK